MSKLSIGDMFHASFPMEGAVCTIDSVYSLSREIRDVLLELDRRYGGEPGPAGLPLGSMERHALLDAGAVFSSNPLPL